MWEPKRFGSSNCIRTLRNPPIPHISDGFFVPTANNIYFAFGFFWFFKDNLIFELNILINFNMKIQIELGFSFWVSLIRSQSISVGRRQTTTKISLYYVIDSQNLIIFSIFFFIYNFAPKLKFLVPPVNIIASLFYSRADINFFLCLLMYLYFAML